MVSHPEAHEFAMAGAIASHIKSRPRSKRLITCSNVTRGMPILNKALVGPVSQITVPSLLAGEVDDGPHSLRLAERFSAGAHQVNLS